MVIENTESILSYLSVLIPTFLIYFKNNALNPLRALKLSIRSIYSTKYLAVVPFITKVRAAIPQVWNKISIFALPSGTSKLWYTDSARAMLNAPLSPPQTESASSLNVNPSPVLVRIGKKTDIPINLIRIMNINSTNMYPQSVY